MMSVLAGGLIPLKHFLCFPCHFKAKPHTKEPCGLIIVIDTMRLYGLQNFQAACDLTPADVVQRGNQRDTDLRILRKGRLQDRPKGLAMYFPAVFESVLSVFKIFIVHGQHHLFFILSQLQENTRKKWAANCRPYSCCIQHIFDRNVVSGGTRAAGGSLFSGRFCSVGAGITHILRYFFAFSFSAASFSFMQN